MHLAEAFLQSDLVNSIYSFFILFNIILHNLLIFVNVNNHAVVHCSR